MSTFLRSSLALPGLGIAAIAVALILLPIDRRLAMEVLLVLAMAQG
jgi:hypothetical protein